MGYLNPLKQRNFQRNWMARVRAAWLAENGPCKRCGSSERLEVHHKDPATKVSHRVWSWAPERRAEELAKCEVLCHECHRQETRAWYAERFPIVHGNRNRGYKRGCRCMPCTSAAVQYNRELAAKRRAQFVSSAEDLSARCAV
jgi:5-methylcytosine-specific restriction endonuclease McrA